MIVVPEPSILLSGMTLKQNSSKRLNLAPTNSNKKVSRPTVNDDTKFNSDKRANQGAKNEK